MNFLKEIAKAKVFDMSGHNSIESARKAGCFDVLLYASEEKEYNEAQFIDHQEK